MENLIKLTVKTPNQRIDDIQIDCNLQWTVRKLKEYLQDVYPSNPNSSSQKLIYLGKLLQDHLLLKEVFGEWGSQTLHIVCSDVKEARRDMKTEDIKSATISQSSRQNNVYNSSVRYRGAAAGCTAHTQLPEESPENQNVSSFPLPSYYQLQESMSPSQQQQYQQYIQHYMQYYYQWQMMVSQMSSNQMQYPGFQPITQPTTSNLVNTPSAMGNSLQQELPQQQQPEQHQQEQQQNQFQNLMNAGPGALQGADDNHPNPRQRDWLDLVYMLMRGLMLFSIVYFYSSTSRFFMVLLLGFILYLYKTGWFSPQRHHENPDGNLPNPNVGENRAEDSNRLDSGPNQNGSDNNANNINGISATNDGNNSTNDNQNIQKRPSILRVAWTFFCAFFGSLIPASPRPIEN